MVEEHGERELHECTVMLQTSLQPDMEASMMVVSEIIRDKLKSHHRNVGTLRCKEALSEKKWLCAELGLLRKEDQEMINETKFCNQEFNDSILQNVLMI